MSVLRVVLGTVLLGCLVGAAGCQAQLTVQSKSRFKEDNVFKEASTEWNPAQTITIKSEGVGISVNGGVRVTADPNAKKVTANARVLAMAILEEKSNADLSVAEVKATYQITSDATSVTVSCGHGGTHGTSSAGESGCELIEVTIPTGNATTPISVTVLGGNGDMTIQLAAATIKNVGVNLNANGTISADIPSSPNANVSLVSSESGDIAVSLPADWAADEVILQADADKITNAFTDAKIGQGAGGRGTPGTGLASLKVTSQEFAGSTGAITLRQE